MSKASKDKKKEIFKNIQIGLDYQDVKDAHGPWRSTTERLLRYLEGDYTKPGYDNKYIVNNIYNFVNILVPNLFYEMPYVRLTAAKPEFIYKEKGKPDKVYNGAKCAMLMESLLNNELKKMDVEEQFRQCIQDTLFAGFSIDKTGYSSDTDPDSDDDYLEEKGSIFSQRVDPMDFLFDPLCTDITNARWVVHRFTESLEAVKNSPNYKNNKDLIGVALDDSDPKKKTKEDSKDTSDYIVLYEYHDLIENMIYTVTKDTGKKKRILWERKNTSPIKEHFTALRFTRNNSKFRGIPMAIMIEDEALAANELFTLMIRHYQLFPGTFLFEQGAVDEDEISKFENAEQGAFLFVQPGTLQNKRYVREAPLTMGSDYFNGIATVNQVADRVLGIPEFQRADQQAGRRKTATEVSLEGQDAGIRRAYFLHFVRKFIIEVSKKVASLIQTHYTSEDAVFISGEFNEWLKPDIGAIRAGEYNYDFEVSSLTQVERGQAQGLTQLLQIAGQAPELFKPMLAKINPEKTMKLLAKGMNVPWDAISNDEAFVRRAISPHTENQILLDSIEEGKVQRLPDPNPGEKHMEEHIPVHKSLALQIDPSTKIGQQALEEASRHIEMHMAMMQVVSQWPGQLFAEQQGQGAPEQPPQQQAPAPESAAQLPTEGEAVGGFTQSTEPEV